MSQLNLFPCRVINGMITGLPIPQEKSVLYPLINEPDANYHSYWRYSRETRTGWIFLIVRCIGYGSFNGVNDLLYCELANGDINEFGPLSLFPAKEEEILDAFGEEALSGYRSLIEPWEKKKRSSVV